MQITTIFGTRPEAIKMAPVVSELRRRAESGVELTPRVYVSAQHRDLLDRVLSLFEIEPDADLDVMQPGQDLAGLTARMLTGLHTLLQRNRPDLVLVHGDTTTALAGALAAYYLRIPVGHVEAGLRTRDRYSPFPEEMNRHLVDTLAVHHFAPTERAAAQLRAEGISPAGIVVTGNTGIDALLMTRDRLRVEGPERVLARHPELVGALRSGRRVVLVTSHRRENFGAGLVGICEALRDLAASFPDVEIIYPVHPNPNVRATVGRLLTDCERIRLIAPLDYDAFCYLMDSSYLVLTDSGGIQEEAPSLDRPVLVLRDTSERPEAVEAGAARVVGTHRESIVSAATRLLEDEAEYRQMASAANPFGDGHAAKRIADAVGLPPCNWGKRAS